MRKLIAILLACMSASAAAETLTVKPERTLVIQGTVAENVLLAAPIVDRMSAESKKPIYMIINSPGGSVNAGLVLISAMRAAKARKVDIICVSSIGAASMAFQIFAECSRRYTFVNTFLMWHPMRVFIIGTSDELEHTFENMAVLEDRLNTDLMKVLKIPPSLFYYHHRHETYWTAAELQQITPNFLTILDDVRGVKGLFVVPQED